MAAGTPPTSIVTRGCWPKHAVGRNQQLAVLRILVDRRRSLGEDHTRMVCQLHQLLLVPVPSGAKRDLSAAQAKAVLAKVRHPIPRSQPLRLLERHRPDRRVLR